MRTWSVTLFTLCLATAVMATGCQPTASDCKTDGDCDDGEICVSGGGILLGGGRCLPERTFAPDTGVVDAPPADGETDTAGGRDSAGEPDTTRDSSGLPDACPPADEQCNGTDDDCDGVIDEGCPCPYDGRSDGVCSDGTTSPDGECQAPSTWEADESTCDARDNDCDGVTDETCSCTPGEIEDCYSGPPGTRGEGPCAEGERTCGEDGSWGPCSDTLPDDEMCNGVDDDCDGNTDEGLVRECDKQLGVCTGKHARCENGEWPAECGPDEYGPNYQTTETKCDGLDNDCDGEADNLEGLTCNDVPGACTSCKGVCSSATVTCSDGATECDPPSDYESSEIHCQDGLDNDCDGDADCDDADCATAHACGNSNACGPLMQRARTNLAPSNTSASTCTVTSRANCRTYCNNKAGTVCCMWLDTSNGCCYAYDDTRCIDRWSTEGSANSYAIQCQ